MKPIELFSIEEWEILKEICSILQPFKEIITEMSAEKISNISNLIVIIRGLQTFLNKKKSDNNTEVISALLDKYISNLNRRFFRLEYHDVFAISTYLGPRLKSKGFTDSNVINNVKSKISYCLIFQLKIIVRQSKQLIISIQFGPILIRRLYQITLHLNV